MKKLLLASAILLFGVVPARSAFAHCDTMDGPVVSAARDALASENVSSALAWVRPVDEEEVRDAFVRTLAVRGQSPAVAEIADRWFFETLVRLHRAGEHEPYEGLRPGGADLGPVVPAVDDALATGSSDALTTLLVNDVRSGLLERYRQAVTTWRHDPNDVAAGRERVAAYVALMHYAEGVHSAAIGRHAEHPEPGGAAPADASSRTPGGNHAAGAHDDEHVIAGDTATASTPRAAATTPWPWVLTAALALAVLVLGWREWGRRQRTV